MAELWEEIFDFEVPAWLVRFEEAPTAALDELLFQRFFHGHLQVAEPEDLLADWLQMLGDAEGFTTRLDAELRAWVERHWGGVPEKRRVRRWADAWQCLANIVSSADDLPLTLQALRARFSEAREVLGAFSTSPSRDPLGRYLWALAGHQTDRSLEAFWWSMCNLGDDVTFYHASYAVAGVAGLPPRPGEEGGGFRDDVVHAVLRVGRALDQLVRRWRLQSKQAEEEYSVVLGWALAAFPFPDRWGDVLAARWRTEPEWLQSRLIEHVRGLKKVVQKHRGSRPQTRDWKKSNDLVVRKLRRSTVDARAEAEKLLDEARAHAEVTGDSVPLNRALCRFSSTVAAVDGQQAVAWAEEAVAWEPWNDFSWTTLTKGLHRAGRWREALVNAWSTVERFPENVVARNGLGEVLKSGGRLEEAEAVFRETVERFPENVVARTGLGEVLKSGGRLEEAEAVFRETVERFPENVVARTGLGEVLKSGGRLEEAEAVFRETVERFPSDDYARTGLESVLRLQDRPVPELRSETRPFVPNEAANQESGIQRISETPGQERRATPPGELDEAHSSAEADTGDRAYLSEEIRASQQAYDAKKSRPSSHVPKPKNTAAFEVHESPSSTGSRHDLRTRKARLLRRAARRAETSPETAGPSPTTLRENARRLLEDVLAERPNDVRALTEKGLLFLDSGVPEAAQSLLDEHAERLPASPLLWTSLGRAVREEARSLGRRLDEEAEGDVLRAPGHLRALDHAYEPLARLQEGRAYLALTDGDARLKGAANSFERLRRWVVRNESGLGKPDFEAWYSTELRRYALARIDVETKLEPADVEAVATCLEENSRIVDVLEEEFALRWT